MRPRPFGDAGFASLPAARPLAKLLQKVSGGEVVWDERVVFFGIVFCIFVVFFFLMVKGVVFCDLKYVFLSWREALGDVC